MHTNPRGWLVPWRKVVADFREFLLQGSVIDLAVAVVIGAAFGAVVASFVENLLTPLVAAVFGEPDFAGLTFTINDSTFSYGAFINALLAFGLVAAAIAPTVARSRREQAAATKPCEYCLSERDPDCRDALRALRVGRRHVEARGSGKSGSRAEPARRLRLRPGPVLAALFLRRSRLSGRRLSRGFVGNRVHSLAPRFR